LIGIGTPSSLKPEVKRADPIHLRPDQQRTPRRVVRESCPGGAAARQRDVQLQVEEVMASKNKYVIRYSADQGTRVRRYFTSKREAEAFARERGLPKSQIKAL